jgi:hypothetical protein
MNRRWLGGGHAKWLPIPDIKPGTMPGAFDLVSIVIPIPQRSAIMSADVIDTEKLFADSKDQDNLITDLDQLLFAIRDFIFVNRKLKFRHYGAHGC